jgi:uncharacterized small protein (DUF1192 family)
MTTTSRKKIAHEIGQDLTLLSVEELAARVQLLADEIRRLEADMVRKNASRSAADQFSKSDGARALLCRSLRRADRYPATAR